MPVRCAFHTQNRTPTLWRVGQLMCRPCAYKLMTANVTEFPLPGKEYANSTSGQQFLLSTSESKKAGSRDHTHPMVAWESVPITLVFAVEENESVGQVIVDEVCAAAEGVVDHGAGLGLHLHDAGYIPDRDARVVDSFQRVLEERE